MKVVWRTAALSLLVAPSMTAAAGPDAHLLGMVGAAPNRIAITALSIPVQPGATASERSFLQSQYFETATDRGGKKLVLIASVQIVDCQQRTTKTGTIVGYDEQGALASKGQGSGQATVPPPRSIAEKMVDAGCSGDWSKFDRVPDLPLTTARALIFGVK